MHGMHGCSKHAIMIAAGIKFSALNFLFLGPIINVMSKLNNGIIYIFQFNHFFVLIKFD